MFRLAVATLFASLALSLPVHAQSQCSALIDQGYSCALPLNEFQNGTTARLSAIKGDIQITSDTQFSQAASVVPLNVGDAVVVLSGGSANLAFGPACSRQLPAQSSLVVRTQDGCVYPSIVEVQEFAQSQNLSVGEEGSAGMGAALVGEGLLASAALAALLLLDEDDDPDPVSP
jgi:hypothetical protein